MVDSLKNVQVVVGIIINSGNKILIAKRPHHVFCPDFWEFPGGKIHRDESPIEALERECQEEIGIRVSNATPFIKVHHDYPDYSVDLDAWLITDYCGTPRGMEKQILCWTGISHLSRFRFLEGNKEIFVKLHSASLRSSQQ